MRCPVIIRSRMANVARDSSPTVTGPAAEADEAPGATKPEGVHDATPRVSDETEPYARNRTARSARAIQMLRGDGTRGFLYLALAISATAYWRLPKVYFVSDDFVNFVTIADRGPFHFIIAPFAGHMGATRNIITWLLFAVFGPDAGPFGWLALVTHLINVTLFFRIAYKFTASRELAALGAAIWGTCPLLSGALGWYSVYGHALSGTMLLIVLDQIAGLRETREPITLKRALLWAGLLVIGTNAFGVGISVAYAFPVALATLFRNPRRERALFAVFLPLPILIAGFYFGWKWAYAKFYEPLPLAENMMQEYALKSIGPPLAMLGHLFAVGISGVLQGYWFLPVGDPVTVWPLVVVYANAVLWVLATGDTTMRRRIIALLFICAAVYGLIALARANLYLMFNIKPAVAAVQIRYHYVGTVLLGLILVLVLDHARRWLQVPALPVIVLSGWIALSTSFFLNREWKINEHADCKEYVEKSLAEIGADIDSQPVGTDVYVQDQVVPPFCAGIFGYDAIPGRAALFAITYRNDEVRGRRVHFIEPQEHRGLFVEPKHHRLSKLLASR